MKILIRDAVQNQYLNSRDEWVADVQEARDFGQSTAAISHARKLGLNGIDLFFVFPNPHSNFATPLEAHESPGTAGPNGRAVSGNGE